MDLNNLSPHDKAMIAKADGLSAPQPSDVLTPGAPAVAAPIAAAATAAAPAAAQAATDKPATAAAPVQDKAAEATLDKPEDTPAKFDASPFYKEFSETGKLSDESFAALEADGLPRSIVEGYIAGQVALRDARDAAGFSLAGGKEQFSKMAEWAAKSLPQAEIDVLNSGLAGTDAQMKQAVLALKAQYEATFGSSPALARGDAPATTGPTPFSSRAEVTAAMRDPRYRTDQAYRQMVASRINLMQDF